MLSKTAAAANSVDDIPMLHCHSTPSLIAASSSAPRNPREFSTTEIDQPSSTSRLTKQRSTNSESEMAAWTSAATVFERTDTSRTAADTDDYVTAHASMVSLTVQNVVSSVESGNKPRNLGTVFINIAQIRQQYPTEGSPTPSIQTGDVCRICHGESTVDAPLIAPCNCSGSMKFVHQECIQTWLKSSHSMSCELCRFTYLTGTKMKPLGQWKPLALTLLERWKIVCCVMIQLFAICYFVLSVEALIRAAKDFHVPQAAMWLWIKIIMSVFGVSVSLACTVRQCKTFARLFRRLEMHNRTVFVKDRSETAEGTSAFRTLLGGPK